MVANHLSNAIKFTPKGGHVEVRLERIGASIEIRVSDTGQGISPEFRPHVFERFSQADRAAAGRHPVLLLRAVSAAPVESWSYAAALVTARVSTLSDSG